MIERIEHQGKTLALLLRSTCRPEGVSFITPDDNPLQVGVFNHKKGTRIEPHLHKSWPRTITETQEVIYIEDGELKASFYDDQGKEIKNTALKSGDMILLISGAHGFDILEDCQIIEIKQGPYYGVSEDKERLPIIRKAHKLKTFEKYAEYYDLIYYDKDYEKECEFIEEIFHKFSQNPIRTILDGGCGTGGHAIRLAKKGYLVTGIDISQMMLKKAKEKISGSTLGLDLYLGDLRQIQLHKKFDACICMFAVMDYIVKTNDFLQTLRNIREHLEIGSLFTFDFWNGLAVLRILPSTRVKIIKNDKYKIIRIAEPELDALNHLCHVHYRLLVHHDDALLDEVTETHAVRFYFPQEIAHYLEDAGFQVVIFCPFQSIGENIDENTWNAAVIARAV